MIPIFIMVIRCCRELCSLRFGCVLQNVIINDPLWELHGGAVERPVLDDEGCAVNAYDVVGGEGPLDDGLGGTVLLGLVVRGVENGGVHDEIVGVGGR